MNKYFLIAIISGILSSFSQVLLKKSSMIQHESKIKEYMNFYVIAGYGITFACMLLMVIAFKGMPLKFGAVMESLVYFHIMILSRIFFGERFTLKKVIGNLLIVFGVIIFSLE